LATSRARRRRIGYGRPRCRRAPGGRTGRRGWPSGRALRSKPRTDSATVGTRRSARLPGRTSCSNPAADDIPIDVDSVRGAQLEERSSSWRPTDVILYHLGLGAGVPATDPAELTYVYEERLHVLPTFGVIPPSPMLFDMLRLPGMDVDLSKLLHGEQ